MLIIVLLVTTIVTINSTTISWSSEGTTSFSWRNGIYGVYNNMLHILGGQDNNGNDISKIYKYNFTSETWLTPANTPSSPSRYRTFNLWTKSFTQVGSKIYYIPRYCGDGQCDNDVNPEMYSYDISDSTFADVWTGGGTEPGGSATGAVCSGDGYIFYIGGFVGYSDWTAYVGAFKFRISTSQWSPMHNTEKAVAQSVCHYYDAGNRLYLFGMFMLAC